MASGYNYDALDENENIKLVKGDSDSENVSLDDEDFYQGGPDFDKLS